jgi:hemoglobin
MAQERRGGVKKQNVYGGMTNASKQRHVKAADGFVPNASLYSRLGGESAVYAAVSLFNEKVSSDVRVKQFFTDKSTMASQFEHQVEFASVLLGKPNTKRTEMRITAKLVELGFTNAHFDAMLESLQAVLQAQKIAPELANEIAQLIEGARRNITN